MSYIYSICCEPFLFGKPLVKNIFFKSFPPKNAQIVNLKNPDLDLIRRIHPENHGFMIRFWICPKKHKIRFWIFPKKRALLFDAITVSMETVMIMLSIVSKSK